MEERKGRGERRKGWVQDEERRKEKRRIKMINEFVYTTTSVA